MCFPPTLKLLKPNKSSLDSADYNQSPLYSIMETNYLKIQSRLQSVLGLDIFSLEKFFSQWVVIIVTCTCVLFTIQAILVFCVANLDDIDAVTDSLTPCFQAVLTSVKYGLFVSNRRRFVRLITRLREMGKGVNHIMEKDILAKENFKDQMFGKVYFGMFFFTGIAAVVVPFIKMAFQYYTTGSYEYILPYIALYPFDTTKLPNYILVCITSTIGSFSVVISTCAMESLFWSFVFNLSGHFKVLCHRVSESFKTSEQNAHRDVNKFAIYHNEILDVYREFNEICQPIVFSQFLISSIQLCFLAFRMAEYITDPKNLYIICLLLSVMTQIFTYCYGGEMLRTESGKLPTSLFYSNWYDHSSKLARKLILPLIVSNRNCDATGYFFVADMSTMTWIIKTAASCVALLRSVNS